jgi:broad specificity phosphatase PhoE
MNRSCPFENRRRVAVLSLALAFLHVSSRAAEPPAPAGVVYLVRHAEKENGDDPALTAAGRARAEALAARLEGRGIERVLATDTRRARETAAPVAKRLGLSVDLYDPGKLPELAAEVRRAGRSVLVVGHSNTTPALVLALGGEPGPPIAEDEYDRLYRVELAGGATELERIDRKAEVTP